MGGCARCCCRRTSSTTSTGAASGWPRSAGCRCPRRSGPRSGSRPRCTGPVSRASGRAARPTARPSRARSPPTRSGGRARREPPAGPSDAGLLVKLLDAGQRLPVHVHPTRPFAREHLHSCYGKTEAWYVLETAGEDAAVWVGFARGRRPGELADRRWRPRTRRGCSTQMNKSACGPGDGVVVPAGQAHATGAGVFLVEVQEPTDFSILLEWSVTTAKPRRGAPRAGLRRRAARGGPPRAGGRGGPAHRRRPRRPRRGSGAGARARGGSVLPPRSGRARPGSAGGHRGARVRRGDRPRRG